MLRNPKENEEHVGEYDKATQTLTIIKQPFLNNELIISTALHELSHHVQYIQTGRVNHSRTFKQIHKNLLIAAFQNESIDANRLYISSMILSDLLEKETVLSICRKFLKFKGKTINLDAIEYETYEKDGFDYSPYLGLWYRFK